MTGSILFDAIVFLAGAIICVYIAKRLGLSSVIGYLLAGVLIGPYVLGFIGEYISSIHKQIKKNININEKEKINF